MTAFFSGGWLNSLTWTIRLHENPLGISNKRSMAPNRKAIDDQLDRRSRRKEIHIYIYICMPNSWAPLARAYFLDEKGKEDVAYYVGNYLGNCFRLWRMIPAGEPDDIDADESATWADSKDKKEESGCSSIRLWDTQLLPEPIIPG